MVRQAKIAAVVAALSITTVGALFAQSADSTRAPRPRRQFSDSAGARDDRSASGDRGWRGAPGQRHGDGHGPHGFGPSRGGAMGFRDGRGGPGGEGFMRGAMMRGITLSESQERAMRAIRVKHISSMKPLQIEMITARADAEIAQLNGDQKGLDAANGRLTSSREQMQKLMKEQSPTTDLRGVLTPDQQKTLDKNLSDGAQRRSSMRGMQGMRGMRGPGGMEGYRQAEPRRGFSPREGRRPGMMPRRFDENDANKDSTDDSTDHVRQNP